MLAPGKDLTLKEENSNRQGWTNLSHESAQRCEVIWEGKTLLISQFFSLTLVLNKYFFEIAQKMGHITLPE